MSRTINGMNALQLKQLYKDTIYNINTIKNSIDIINSNLEKSNNANVEINWDNTNDWFLYNIKLAYNEIYWHEWSEEFDPMDWKLEKIKEAYEEILGKDENNEVIWLKAEIKEFIDYINLEKEKVENFTKKIWGETKPNEDWEDEKIDWLFDNINKFHNIQKGKFDKLYKKIDTELEAWTTSVALAKVFSDKVNKYKNAWMFWQGLFILIIWALLYNINWTFDIEDWRKLLVKMFSHLPLFILSIWLLIFIWNRRAEAKKLEEWYKHKEVMARSFIGYKKSIEDLEWDLEDNDKKLMREHMNNLLKTINQDTSSFLGSKWENHPFLDIFKNIFKKENFPNWLIETEYWKIEFNKKW